MKTKKIPYKDKIKNKDLREYGEKDGRATTKNNNDNSR